MLNIGCGSEMKHLSFMAPSLPEGEDWEKRATQVLWSSPCLCPGRLDEFQRALLTVAGPVARVAGGNSHHPCLSSGLRDHVTRNCCYEASTLSVSSASFS